MNSSAPLRSQAPQAAPRYPADLAGWLAWQEQIHTQAIELGLDRCRAVAARMGLLHPPHWVLSVAGTNGKGSSVTLLEAILRCAGYRTGAYTSPHLVRYNERIRLSGAPVTDAELCRVFSRVERARGDISLTYFEFGTLAALELFQQAGVDVALLEVGLGGRLDAVNILDADLALISSIGIDHQDWLGSDRNAIGREKAGICRPGVAAVCSDPNPPPGLLEQVAALPAPLALAARDFHLHAGVSSWSWRSSDREYQDLPLPHPYSRCQMQNAAGVLMALDLLTEQLPVSELAIRSGLQCFQPEGRFQLICGAPCWILDVAHNEQAAQELCSSLAMFNTDGALHVVAGMLRDKDHKAVLSPLLELADTWHMVDVAGARGYSAAALAGQVRQWDRSARVRSHGSMAAALSFLQRHSGVRDRVLITGSFITVGAALALLDRNS